MNNLITRFVTLPPGLQLGLCVMGSGGLIVGLMMLANHYNWPRAVIIVIILGVVVIGLLLGGYAYLLKRRKKRKADPFEREIADSGGAVPQTVTDVADRARLDDMRKKFEKGVAAFRQHGKDLYGLPWYVIIGEPGSGKTEAIRHCGIGFPPGLQDELQGTGGTINMDWWFTNQAVILDTAGRLTFGDVESTDTREWKEFLSLLRKNRPNCPINGLLITIPVDSLIQDDADQLEKKGGRIARQLDLIQRTLGVRFPVFIVVTKADKLVGFRQFFSELRDPQLQHQMLGWSNPLSLDEPFDPAPVDEHLSSVRQRLMQRRLTRLLEDSSSSAEGSTRRTDRVDELYAFPEAMQRISSRLRRYLELIFVGGEWSSKPLFLRGIYFTSSMQHGEALDAELADALGVPVDSLHESAWTDDRAYFLRDVFVEKVFRERGLVTNATNTRSRQRRRRTLLVGAGAIGAALFLGLTVWAWISYRDNVRGHDEFWTNTWETYKEYRDVQRDKVGGDASPRELENHRARYMLREGERGRTGPYSFNGLDDKVLPVRGGGKASLGRYFPDCMDMAGAEIEVPLAFWLPAIFTEGGTDSLIDERREACESLFVDCVLEPLVQAAEYRFETGWDGGSRLEWTPEAITALAQLIELTSLSGEGGYWITSGDDREDRSFSIEDTLRFSEDTLRFSDAAEPEDIKRKQQVLDDVGNLQDVCDWLYQSGGGNAGLTWPPASLAGEVNAGRLTEYLHKFNEYWRSELLASQAAAEAASDSGALELLRSLEQRLRDFEVAEDKLLSLELVDDRDLERTYWDNDGSDSDENEFANLRTAKADLDEAAKVLGGGLLKEKYLSEFMAMQGRVALQYDQLLAAVQNESFDPREEESRIEALWVKTHDEQREANVEYDNLTEREQLLVDGWGTLRGSVEEDNQDKLQELARLDAMFLKPPRAGGLCPYEVRYQIYEIANDALALDEDTEDLWLGQLSKIRTSVTEDLEEKARQIRTIVSVNRRSTPGEPGGETETSDVASRRLLRCQDVCEKQVIEVLAPKERQHNLAGEFVERLRRELEENERSVSELVADEVDAERFEANDAVEIPPIPFTELQSLLAADQSKAMREYRPEVAGALFDDWVVARSLASEAGSESQALLNRLDRRLENYADDYVTYWTETVIGQIDPLASAAHGPVGPDGAWTDFIGELADTKDREFGRNGLEKMATVIRGALGELRKVIDTSDDRDRDTPAWDIKPAISQNLNDALDDLETAEDENDVDGFKAMRRRWLALGGDASTARKALMSQLRAQGPELYFIRGGSAVGISLENFFEQYWKRLVVRALNALVLQAGTEADARVRSAIEDNSKFPLVGDEGTPLERGEVRAARNALDEALRDARSEDAAAGGDSVPSALGLLPPTHQDLFRHLWNPLGDEGQEDIRKLSAMAAMANALPSMRFYSVDVYALTRPEGEAEPDWDTWTYLTLEQGNNQFDGEVMTLPPYEVKLDLELRYPSDNGDTIEIRFYRPGGDTLDTRSYEGPWALFRMIADCEEVRLVDDDDAETEGLKWWINMLCERNDQSFSFWLLLEFDDKSPLPKEALHGWPCLREDD